MSFDIQQYMDDESHVTFYTEYYAINALGLIARYKKQGLIKELPIAPTATVKYEGDFYGLLDSIRIPKRHHRILLLVNGLHSPSDYQGNINAIKVIDTDELDDLATLLSGREE